MALSTLVDTSVLAGPSAANAVDFEGGWVVSAITVGELEAGVLLAQLSAQRAARLARVAAVLAAAPIIAVDRAVSARYSELRAATGRLPTNNLWIAATALAHDLMLLTADRRQAALPLVRVTLVD